MRRCDWWLLFEDLKDASMHYAELRVEINGLRTQWELAERDLRGPGWEDRVHAGWSRDYFAMQLRAHTFKPKISEGDLHNLRSLAGLVQRFITVRDAVPDAAAPREWAAYQRRRSRNREPDLDFLERLSHRDWQPVTRMLNYDTWKPPRNVSLAELTTSPAYELYRLRTYADKRVAHLNVGNAHAYFDTRPLDRETVLWHAATYVGLNEMLAAVDLLEEAVGNLDLFFGHS